MILGHTEPRIFTKPLRELTPETTLGFDVIDFAQNVLDIELYDWQKWLFIHALEIIGDFGSDWYFRYETVVVLVGRQNGKTFIGKILATYFLYVLNAGLVIGTAQSLDRAEDTWQETVSMVSEIPALACEIEHIWQTNGAKRLALTGDRNYRVKASSRAAGRGSTGDLVLLDELREHQNWDAWGAVSSTTTTVEHSLLWCMSNAGDATSVVLRHLRQKAHLQLGDPDGIASAAAENEASAEVDVSGETLGLFEWSAEPKAEPSDREAWAAANPMLNQGIPERKIASAFSTEPKEVFLTERLCQWVTISIAPPFPVGAWEAGTDNESVLAPDAKLFYGVDVSTDRTKTAIAVCGFRSDRKYHGELVAYRPGINWLQTWFQKAAARAPLTVAMQGRGAPVSAFVDILNAIDGVTVIKCEGADVAGWAGRLWDAVSSCEETSDSDAAQLKHRTQPALDLAAQIAVTRPMGDGAWAWDRNKSIDDISPLVALTMAHGAATSEEAPKKSAYEEMDGVLFV